MDAGWYEGVGKCVFYFVPGSNCDVWSGGNRTRNMFDALTRIFVLFSVDFTGLFFCGLLNTNTFVTSNLRINTKKLKTCNVWM